MQGSNKFAGVAIYLNWSEVSKACQCLPPPALTSSYVADCNALQMISWFAELLAKHLARIFHFETSFLRSEVVGRRCTICARFDALYVSARLHNSSRSQHQIAEEGNNFGVVESVPQDMGLFPWGRECLVCQLGPGAQPETVYLDDRRQLRENLRFRARSQCSSFPSPERTLALSHS